MTKNDYTLRHNTASIDQIRSHLREVDECFIPSLSTKVDIEAYAEKISRNADTIEAWQGNHLVGVVAVYLNDADRITAYITNVSVAPSLCGSGVADKMMYECFDLAENRGFQEIILEVNIDNQRAINFYIKNGFVEDRRTPESIFMVYNLARDKSLLA
jgi:ribosomal protein S18 acetylase RimI-like enzyme